MDEAIEPALGDRFVPQEVHREGALGCGAKEARMHEIAADIDVGIVVLRTAPSKPPMGVDNEVALSAIADRSIETKPIARLKGFRLRSHSELRWTRRSLRRGGRAPSLAQEYHSRHDEVPQQ